MGSVYSVNVAADTTLVTTAETVIATLPGVSMSRPGQQIRLHGNATITTGGSTTNLVFRVRRDSLTGALVDESQSPGVAVAAGGTEDHDFVVTDAPTAELAGQTYVLTVAQTAAAANGTALHASLEAEVL